MILILSTRNDTSTFEVVEWLMYYKKDFVILYDDDIINIKIISPTNFVIEREKDLINLGQISCFWHRTAFHKFNYNILKDDLDKYIIERIEIESELNK